MAGNISHLPYAHPHPSTFCVLQKMGTKWGTKWETQEVSDMAKWKSTSHKGVRYREHPTRKQGDAQYDRYYAVRYQRDGERHELGLGWASEGMTEPEAALMLAQCKKAARTGGGPVRRNKMDEKRAQKASPQRSGGPRKRHLRGAHGRIHGVGAEQQTPLEQR